MLVSERTGSRCVHLASSGYPWWESDTVGTEPVVDVFTGRHDVRGCFSESPEWQ